MAQQQTDLPVLYSYIHCPYCLRARLAIAAGGVSVRLREVALPEKPAALLEASPKGTVPVLLLPGGQVIDQSLAVMDWAIAESDPVGLGHLHTDGEEIRQLIENNDTRFAKALVRLKHPERFAADTDTTDWAQVAQDFLAALETRLQQTRYLAGGHVTKADFAIVPFVLQYAAFRPETLKDDHFPRLAEWATGLRDTPFYHEAMQAHPAWQAGAEEPLFP